MIDSSPTVLILGGGVAGLSAADYLNACGVSVHLLEKTDHLGGKARDWACMATDTCRHCGACLSAELADRVGRLENVSVRLESSVTQLTRQNGRFKAVVGGRAPSDLTTDAVLIATGMALYDPSEREDLGYATHTNVITTAELNTLIQQDALADRLGKTPQPAIAFIQCVGSRNREKGRDYCSRVCCKNAIRQAHKIMHTIPDAAVTIFNIDLQATGKGFRSQVHAAAAQIEMLQGTPAKILDNVEPGKLTVFHEDGLAGRSARHFDLVVLSVGVLPAPGLREIAGMLDIETDTWGFLGSNGTDLPDGIYTAGATGGPTSILDAIGQGKASACRIARSLGCLPETPKKTVAIFGGDDNAGRIATTLAERGYPIATIASGDQPFPTAPGGTHYPSARLTRVVGTTGNYTVQVTTPDGPRTINAGALVVAPRPALQPAAINPDIGQALISLTRFLALCDQKDALPKRILFWLDHNGPERKDYVKRIMQVIPDLAAGGKQVTILMEKMLVNYPNGQKIYDTVRGLGVKLLRVSGQQQVSLQPGGDQVILSINEEATLPGMTLTVACDLLVIPENVTASENGREISGQLRQPLDSEGFLQSANVRHRNVGSPRRGIYYAGFSHAETDPEADIAEIIADLERPLTATTPGELPVINTGACIRCLTCFRICPHGAIVLRNHYQTEIVPSACFGCTLCVANCPALAIETSALPDTGTTQTVVFACERSASLAAPHIDLPDETVVVSVPCACSVDTGRILQTLGSGARQVIIAACHAGNCRSFKGAAFAVTGVRKLLENMGITKTRASSINIAANEAARLKRMIKNTVLTGQEE